MIDTPPALYSFSPMRDDPKDNTDRTKAIKKRALDLGFHAVGVTSADPVEEDGRRFSKWLSDGFGGAMSYLQKAPEERADPKGRFPEAKRVICLALNYYQEEPALPDGAQRGKIARYAWGEDYHLIIEEKLAHLMDAIGEQGGRCWKGYVDHGPLLERAFAQRAGLGFIGKNTNLITPEYGSWVFLAEVVTDLELAIDSPAIPECGACRICIDACPTGALTDPYRLDARRCLSYLTIESKGPIPEPLLPRLEGWLFGCDICQEVCPYNDDRPVTDEPRLAPSRGAGPSLPIDEALAIKTNGGFEKKFEGSPLLRMKRSGLIRNARALREVDLVSKGEAG